MDYRHLKTGAHVELLLGETFFLKLIHLYYDAEKIPGEFSLSEGYKLKIDRPSSVKIKKKTGFKPSDIELTFSTLIVDENGVPLRVNVNTETKIYFIARPEFERNEEGAIDMLYFNLYVSDFEGYLESAINAINLFLILANKPQVEKSHVLQLLNTTLGGRRPMDFFKPDTYFSNLGFKYFYTGQKPALGLYFALALKKGPEPENIDRPDLKLDKAINFLVNNEEFSLAIPASVYGLLQTDLMARVSKENPPGSGYYTHPIKDGSTYLGQFRRITVTPMKERVYDEDKNYVGEKYKGGLHISIEGNIKKYGGELDFQIGLSSWAEWKNGNMKWNSFLGEPNIKLSKKTKFALSWFLGGIVTIVFSALLSFISPMIGVYLGLLTFFTGFFGGDAIATEIAESLSGSFREKAKKALSPLDVLSDRFTLVRRRLDPFYYTLYQLKIEKNHFDISDEGMSFSGTLKYDIVDNPIETITFQKAVENNENEIEGYIIKVNADMAVEEEYFGRLPEKMKTQITEHYFIEHHTILSRKPMRWFSNSLFFQVPLKLNKKRGRIEKMLLLSNEEHRRIELNLINNHIQQSLAWFESNLKNPMMHDVNNEMQAFIASVNMQAEDIIQFSINHLIVKDEASIEGIRNHYNNWRERVIEEERIMRFNKKKEDWLDGQITRFTKEKLTSLYNPEAYKIATLQISPNALGQAQMDGVIALFSKYKLHQTRKGTYFFKTKRNKTKSDNLSNLPRIN